MSMVFAHLKASRADSGISDVPADCVDLRWLKQKAVYSSIYHADGLTEHTPLLLLDRILSETDLDRPFAHGTIQGRPTDAKHH